MGGFQVHQLDKCSVKLRSSSVAQALHVKVAFPFLHILSPVSRLHEHLLRVPHGQRVTSHVLFANSTIVVVASCCDNDMMGIGELDRESRRTETHFPPICQLWPGCRKLAMAMAMAISMEAATEKLPL